MKKLTVFIVLIMINFQIVAQSNFLEFKAKYEQAKSNLKNKKFELAKNDFLQLYSNRHFENYLPYISYFLGQAYFSLKQYQLSENQLLEIIKTKHNWSNIHNVYVLLAYVYLEKMQAEIALDYLNKIKSEAVLKELEPQLIKYFVNQKYKEQIKPWAAKYPNIKLLQTITSQTNELEIYDLNPTYIPILQEKPKTNFSKNYYNIGLLLPFQTDSINNANQYVYDIYDGMKIAQEKLKLEKININLFSYQVGNNKNDILKLLNNSQFLENDILVGPMYAEPNKIAQYYANKRQVTLVNPLSRNRQLVNNKPFTFLNKASAMGYAKQAVKFATYNFTGEFAVVYEGADTLQAHYITNELMAKRVKFVKIKYTDENFIANYSKKKFGGIFLLSQAKNNMAIISNLEKKYGIVPIIIQKDQLPDIQKFTSQISPELYIFNQDFVDENNENVQKFKTEYWEKRNNLSSFYTYKGYDMMLFWGRQIAKYKQKHLEMLVIIPSDEDYLVNGFNYSTVSNENVAFVITTLQNGVETFYRRF